MTALEVFLIIVGILCICASFFISRRQMGGNEESNSAGDRFSGTELWTQKDEEIVRNRLKEILKEEQAASVDETKEQMGRLCNEKIMAIDDFSSQILEKINSNHQEVVFMYNMLNEKQKEIKTIMTTPAPTPAPQPVQVMPDIVVSEKKQVSDPVYVPERTQAKALVSQTNRQTAPVRKQQPAATAKTSGSSASAEVPVSKTAPRKQPATGLSQVRKAVSRKSTASQSTVSAEPVPTESFKTKPASASTASAKTGNVKTASAKTAPVKNAPVRKTEPAESPAVESAAAENRNLQIQKMHKEGKSVLEISKALNIGQGEVKLIIALYGGKKG